jgi:nitrogenase-associated protein
MAKVIFYEKPGCINNTQQKKLLRAAGHNLDERNLLEESWTSDGLRPYFGNLPVAEWFNRTAPAVKYGEVDPDAVTEQEALALMVKMPLLIRRPLIQVAGECRVGFDADSIHQWIGLAETEVHGDLGTCPHTVKKLRENE